MADFARLEARVNEDLTEIHFPVRYTNGSVVGYRRVYYDDNGVGETSYPDQGRQSILPFLHGLYEVGPIFLNILVPLMKIDLF